MQINGKDLQDLTPEELAQMLAEGNPMLVSSWASTSVLHIEHLQSKASISDSILFQSFSLKRLKITASPGRIVA